MNPVGAKNIGKLPETPPTPIEIGNSLSRKPAWNRGLAPKSHPEWGTKGGTANPIFGKSLHRNDL
jgi:hypothetical protein